MVYIIFNNIFFFQFNSKAIHQLEEQNIIDSSEHSKPTNEINNSNNNSQKKQAFISPSSLFISFKSRLKSKKVNARKSSERNSILESQKRHHEKMNQLQNYLNRTQTCLNKSKMSNNILKMSLLTEIIECQYFLTNHSSFRKSFENHISKEKIFDDEWKLIAMIFDRCCFIFCSVALFVNTLVYICILNF